LEYLIKATSGEDLVLPHGSLDQVLSPHGRPSRQLSGSGDYRMAVDGGQIAFSWEAPGWLVMVEGLPEEDAEELLTEIAVQIGAATRAANDLVGVIAATAGTSLLPWLVVAIVPSAAGIRWDRIRRARVRRVQGALISPAGVADQPGRGRWRCWPQAAIEPTCRRK
jgi:hypothetical protein